MTDDDDGLVHAIARLVDPEAFEITRRKSGLSIDSQAAYARSKAVVRAIAVMKRLMEVSPDEIKKSIIDHEVSAWRAVGRPIDEADLRGIYENANLLGLDQVTGGSNSRKTRATKESASSLADMIQIGWPHNNLGHVGFSADSYHVYVYGRRWRGDRPETWDGLPVRWHVGIGKPQPFKSSETSGA